MHNKVVYHTMKAFSSFGLPVLRFNFRSVGLSEGVHDEGYGEQDDVHAALNWMEQQLRAPDSLRRIFLRLERRTACLLRRCPGQGIDRSRPSGAR